MGSRDVLVCQAISCETSAKDAISLRKGHLDGLVQLYSENVISKVLRVAVDELNENVSSLHLPTF